MSTLLIAIFSAALGAVDYAAHHYVWAMIQAFFCGALVVAYVIERALR